MSEKQNEREPRDEGDGWLLTEAGEPLVTEDGQPLPIEGGGGCDGGEE